MQDLTANFGSFTEFFKKYVDDKAFDDLDADQISFDSSKIELSNVDDTAEIIKEINRISRSMFVYGVILDNQTRVLQKLEDEYDTWMASKSVEVSQKNKDLKSEVAKENVIKDTYKEEYLTYKEKIRNEKYKKSLIERVVKGLDSFSYKLHAILTYKQKVVEKTGY